MDAIKQYKLINNNGISVMILSYGGIIREINTPNKNGDIENIVLHHKSNLEYLTDSFYLGGVIGRYANRIGKGTFKLDKNIYHKIKNIQKVSGFLGPEGKPVPVSEKEIKKIMGQIDETEENPSAGITFEVGEKVKVCDGPFASFTGLIEEIDEDKLRLKVSVSIFGRPTPVDLEFNQVEKS